MQSLSGVVDGVLAERVHLRSNGCKIPTGRGAGGEGHLNETQKTNADYK